MPTPPVLSDPSNYDAVMKLIISWREQYQRLNPGETTDTEVLYMIAERVAAITEEMLHRYADGRSGGGYDGDTYQIEDSMQQVLNAIADPTNALFP